MNLYYSLAFWAVFLPVLLLLGLISGVAPAVAALAVVVVVEFSLTLDHRLVAWRVYGTLRLPRPLPTS